MESFSVSFTLTYQDWRHARRMLRRHEKLHYLYDFWFQAAFVPTAVFCSIRLSNTVRESLFYAIGAFVIALFPEAISRLNWHNSSKHMPLLSINFTDNSLGLGYEVKEHEGVSWVKWTAVNVFDEDATILLWITKGSMLYLPKRDISAELTQAIRHLTKKKLGL